MQLSPADIKPHLGLAAGDFGFDAQLAGYIAAAEAHIARYCRRDFAAEFPEGWPADVIQAERLLVAHWFHNREAVTDRQDKALPFGVQALLADFRNYT